MPRRRRGGRPLVDGVHHRHAGLLCGRPDLRKEVMERASVVLIGMVVVAIAWPYGP